VPMFLAREHTQAEYRWIAKLGGGKRAEMPWWGGFDSKVWDSASLLDWAVPVAFCTYRLLDCLRHLTNNPASAGLCHFL